MANLARIKNNVAKMAAQNAPEEDIDGYIASEGVTIEAVRNFRIAQSSAPESQTSKDLRSELSGMSSNTAKALYDQLPEWQKPIQAVQDIFATGLNGLSLGWADKGAAALRSAVTDKTYEEELEGMRARTQAARDRAQSAGTFAEVGASIAAPMGLAARGVTLAGRLGTGAMTGAKGIAARAGLMGAEGTAYGGVTAAGNDTDIGEGMLIGGAAGSAIPVIAGVGKAVAKPFADAVRARTNPGAYAVEKVGERLSNSQGLEQAVTKSNMEQGLTLADVGGKSARDLLRTATNIPGPARDRVNKLLTLRQLGQGDRIKGVIKDVFADPDGFLTAGDKLGKAWSKVGDEVYEPALAKKVVWSDRLKQFVDEPVFQRGLAQGVKIQRLEALAKGEKFNPLDYAITGFNEAGDPILGGVPNMRTLNVAKKGLDVMIGDARHPLTGKMTEEGRALDMVRRAYLETIDGWNPEYKQARGVWGGFAKVKEAMLFGQNDALSLSPEAVSRAFKEMSTSEQQAARIGIADALRKKVDAAGFTNNAVLRIFANRQNVGVLKAAFPDQETFAEFRKSIFNEARKRATYDAVKGNSSTVQQAADLAEAGGMRETMDFARNTVTSGPVNATLNFIGSRLRMLGGMTPEVADQVSRRLMSTSPEVKGQIIKDLEEISRAKLSAEAKSQAVQNILIRSLAVGGTMAVSSQAAAQGDTNRPLELTVTPRR